MWTLKIDGDKETIQALRNVVGMIPQKAAIMLDRAATEVQGKMKDEAPVATGALEKSIYVEAPSQFMRVIKPHLLYGEAQEKRNSMPQGMPPLTKIQRWAEVVGATSTPWGGHAKAAAFLIARKIRESGYPANPFVSRTYQWVQGQIHKHLGPFIEGIVATYGKA